MSLTNMTIIELDNLEEKLQQELDERLRNLRYDSDLNTLYDELEEVISEKRRRGPENDG